ncbi:hypothetical protein BZA05DRAFT_366582 [Tricharina praecox]|uniref:uncharacterized protein n=1 Tax=Tricharina praecox TaxID=43433 RepID=UPI00221F1A69|nr:uncharacterized protein BZA05DRAFT_366582 [Tricharina praecox]KAI5858996.1 hypothetical protein BZA05DRAFT_366582 [Tricharina praecox]
MKFHLLVLAFISSSSSATAAATAAIDFSIKTPSELEGNKAAVYYPDSDDDAPLLIGNDGSAGTGGFRSWTMGNALTQKWDKRTGRTKLVGTVYDIAGKDWIVTLSQEDSNLRFFDAEKGTELSDATRKVWGDYSALCSWRNQKSGSQYLYVFGKKEVKTLLVRKNEKTDGLEVVEVSTPKVPIEAQTCVVSASKKKVYFGGDGGKVYSFPAVEASAAVNTTLVAELDDELKGMAVYHGKKDEEYIFLAQAEILNIYDSKFKLLGNVTFTGAEDLEIKDIAIYQNKFGNFSRGAMAAFVEGDDGNYFRVGPLTDVLEKLDLEKNTDFDPRDDADCDDCEPAQCDKLDNCSNNGFCSDDSKFCDCFAGYTGNECKQLECTNDCSGHGECTDNNICKCESAWDGPDCSFKVVHASYETEATGEDGDDPAVWIHPTNASLSRIITTTKSTVGAGLNAFDLAGKKISSIEMGEPNNVDVIYSFALGNRTVDLAYAACRADNTLCLAEITSNGTLIEVSGGSHPTPEDYEVYGSCVYASKSSGKQYLFVNSKTAEYLQYELTSSNGTLATTLVRTFQGGSGGQVEGCVSDDENGVVFIGEEPYGLWRYDAEPDDSNEGTLVDSVDGNFYADVEGVTLVYGKSKDDGYIIVSCQGVSAYNVYNRAAPHEFQMTFTIKQTEDGKIDGVTNTDGVTAVGRALNADFPGGVLVVHDDVNQEPDGSKNPLAAFKIVSLENVLGELLDGVDTEWDPRA